ncbi:Uma2 family endonuclease [Geminocystis herdmanii]|uniref:Uma2 family endonuclease n=1 Tax=Geminocystis herdmanii TaxID=669359 RepID=UPI00034C9F8C|nr:Uma2 family endonuclease [Geminocystis herdmanii]
MNNNDNYIYPELLGEINKDLLRNFREYLFLIEKQLLSLDSLALTEQKLVVKEIFYTTYQLRDYANLLPYQPLQNILYSLENNLITIQSNELTINRNLLILISNIFEEIIKFIEGLENETLPIKHIYNILRTTKNHILILEDYLNKEIQKPLSITLPAPPPSSILTFSDYINQCYRLDRTFEFIDGKQKEVKQNRFQKYIIRLLIWTFEEEIKRLKLPYKVAKNLIIRTVYNQDKQRGRVSHLAVINEDIWRNNISVYGAIIEPPELVIEVISANWRRNYLYKVKEYQKFGVKEYWLIDYLGSFVSNALGKSPIPTIIIYQSINDKYKVNFFSQDNKLRSTIFPELSLTINHLIKVE